MVKETNPGVWTKAETTAAQHAHRQYADRAARPVDQFDRLGQHPFDAVAEDRMRMAAANLHDVRRPLPCDVARREQALDLPDQRLRPVAVAELVDIFHR